MVKKRTLSAVLSTAMALSLIAPVSIPAVFAQTGQQEKPESEMKQVKPVEENLYHPLNPLSEKEIVNTLDILKKAGRWSPDLRFTEITLREPSKSAVWNWKEGEKLPRQASMIALKGKQVMEGIVDLDQQKVLSWTEVKDAQAMILLEEWMTAQQAVLDSSEYKAALSKRGVKDFSKVIATPLSVGYFGKGDANPEQRLLKVVSYLETGDGNFWAHPIEGLVAVVDLVEKKVIEVQDDGVIPIPMKNNAYDKGDALSKREQTKPLVISQPDGPGFKLKGNQVDWQNWNFHVRLEPREGPVISMVTYDDHGKKRKIMYRGALGGMVVPYGDPSTGWYFKTYMDSGEYGVGKLGMPLEVGVDAPDNAVYLNATLADDQGNPYVVPNAMALFERYADPEWKHTDFVTGTNESRSRRELVLRFVSTVGNYDYLFDWVFQQNGNIRINVGATGIEAVKAVNSKTIHDEQHSHDTDHGTLVDEHIVAVHHQHIYNFRLDLDVDGEKNSFVEMNPMAVPYEGEGPRKSVMVVEEKTIDSEQEAAQKFDNSTIRLLVNPNVKNAQGYSTGYQIIPNAGSTHPFAKNPLFTPNDWLMQRAKFVDKHIWITPYDPKERYPEGEYPNQSTTDTGLGLWTQKDRSIQNTDDVVWMTTGATHIARAEEWPMMPTEWASAMIKPFNFFDRTPTLDVTKK